MNRSIWVRLIAVILIISMLAAPVSAATANSRTDYGTDSLISGIINIIRDIIRDIWDDWFDGPGEDPAPTTPSEPGETTAPTTPEIPTDPTEPDVPGPTTPGETTPTQPGETEPVDPTIPTEPVESPEAVLNLEEGHNTENSYLLRGFTYSFGSKSEPKVQNAPYALRGNAINGLSTMAIAPAAETNAEETITTIRYEFSNWVNGGQYYIQCSRAYTTPVNSWLAVQDGSIVGVADQASATPFTLTINDNGTYYLSVDMDGTASYLAITSNGESFSTTPAELTIEHMNNSDSRVTDDGNLMEIGDDGVYLNQNGGRTSLDYSGYDVKNDMGNAMWMYQIVDGTATKVTATAIEEESKLVYFPVTMYDYDEETFNNITHALDVADDPDAAVWNGFYFSDGSPNNGSFTIENGDSETVTKTRVTYELVVPQFDSNGYISNLNTSSDYILVNKRLSKPVVSGTSSLPEGTVITGAGNPTITVDFNEGETVTEIGGASIWKYGTYQVRENTSTGWWPSYEYVTYPCIQNAAGSYMTIGSASASVGSSQVATYIQAWSADSNCVVIKQGSYYLSDLYGASSSNFAGYATLDDDGNPFYIYERKVETVTEEVPNTTTYDKAYSAWNYWCYMAPGASEDRGNQQNKFYANLVQPNLDENDNIIFNVNEPGIFTYGELNEEHHDGTKYVYEYVGLPFVKNEKGYYTFDSDMNGVHFPASDNYTTVPDSGSGDKASEDYMYNMTFLPGAPQTWENFSAAFGDKSSNLWAPYDTPLDVSEKKADGVNYHFGMKAHIPFSMTENGYVKELDTNSDHITFTFAGDDDVWIFIDGQLVIDLGGIHNRLGATIDFAANTVTYEIPDTNKSTAPLGCFNDSANFPVTDNKIVLKLFNEGNQKGLIDMTLQDFASNETHHMSVFYMERGKSASNCKIEFNLPMRDTVSVSKNITHSWSAETGEEYPLTPQEKAYLANKNFYFTLYRKDADSDEAVPVVNTNYYLLDSEGNVISIPSTADDGRFPLKNGQTAKFMTDIPGEGITYYVVEEDLGNGYLTPDFTFGGEASYGLDYTGVTMDGFDATQTLSGHVSNGADIPEQEIPLNADENKSFEITARGSIEATDSVSFICENYLNEQLPNPSSLAEEDIIVLDYGLGVEIDPLANDVFRGDNIEIVYFQAGDVSFDTDGDGEISNTEGDALTGIADTNGDGAISTEESATLSSMADFNGHSGSFHFRDAQYRAEFDDQGNMIDHARDTFTYTMNKQLTEVEVLTYLVRVNGSQYQEGTETTNYAYCYGVAKLYIVPATIMYYEEDFSGLVKFSNGSGAFEPTVKKDAQYVDIYQEPGVVGLSTNHTYGSDPAYLNDSKDSNGTSYFFDTTDGFVRFQYTFTGTGTTFFARTSAKTGYMQVLLFDGADIDPVANRGQQRDVWYRDTYYKDTNGTNLDGDTLYNIPVFTTDGLNYGTYTLVVTVAMAGTPGGGENLQSSGNEFYLDGIRIMQPLNEMANEELTDKALDAYSDDGEANLEVVTLRQKLITDAQDGSAIWDGENFVVLTDTNGEIISPEEYESIGPKEEVYLAPGQKVSFTLKHWERNGLKLYMGMKAPFGSAALYVGKNYYSLANAADCYYDVTASYQALEPVTEEVFTDEGYPMYTDAEGNIVIEILNEDTLECVYYDEEGNLLDNVDANALTPLTEEYYMVTYTFEAAESIVSLTNIKVVGNFEFAIVEDTDITVGDNEGGNE